MAESGIYEIVNLVNGKRYVGSAVDLKRREYQHWYALRHSKHHNVALSRAWEKHGEGAFEFRLIEICALAQLIEREQFHIDLRAEYNCSPTAGSTLGMKFSDEARARISAARIGQRKGVAQSPEHIAKRMAAHIGAKRSPETRAKIAAKAKGRKVVRDDAYRAKVSARFKGKPKSPEHMAALQEGRRKRVFTEEQRAKMAEQTKARWASGGGKAFGRTR